MFRGQVTRRAGRVVITLALTSVAAILTMFIVGGPNATAQLSDCETGLFQVSTADEFNTAIDCHNSAVPNAGVTIELQNDIAADTVAGASVFRPIEPSGTLVIDGRGHTLSRAAGAPSTLAPLLLLTDPAEPGLQFSTRLVAGELALEVGGFDTAAFQQDGRNELSLRSVAITSAPGAYIPIATGVIVSDEDGRFDMSYSLIEGVQVGIEMNAAVYTIEKSTIQSYGIDFSSFSTSGLGGIFNSTLAGPVGIEFRDAVVRVSHTTITGDGATAVPGAEGVVVFDRSNLVASCSAPEILTGTQPGPGFVDIDRFEGFTSNFGGCFGRPEGPQRPLGDNGCINPTPLGCPRTVALDASSNALGQGDCSDTIFGDLARDQRGALRTPLGAGCDPGAFEYNGCELVFAEPPLTSPSVDIDVATALEFNSAIECLNSASSNGANVAINLVADIEATAIAGPAVFEQIIQGLNSNLTIYGDGFAIRRGPSAPNISAPLLSVADNTLTDIEIFEVRLDLAANDTHGLDNDGEGDLRLIASAITAPEGSTATGIRNDTASSRDLLIRGSAIENLRVGVQASGGTMVVGESTLTSSEIDVISGDGLIATVSNSTLTAPVGLQFGSGLHYLAYSTVLGDGAVPAPGSQGWVRIISSIVGSCSAPVVTPDSVDTADAPYALDESGNVGRCFDFTQSIDTELADNGCFQPGLAFDCTKTVALTADSPAIGAGDCRETDGGLVTTDQRGEPRTPVGLGCDSGAFEFNPCSTAVGTGFDVDSQGTLDAAIRCFNQGSLGSSTYDIELTGDIELAPSLFSGDALVTAIDQPDAGRTLIIDGGGYTINAPEPLGLSNPPPPPRALLAVSATNAASIQVRDIALDADPSADVNRLLWHRSAAPLTIETSRLRSVGLTQSVLSDGGATIAVSNSEFELAISTGLEVDNGGQATITNSTFANLQPTDFAPALAIFDAGLQITNSTFDQAPLLTAAESTGTIANSTLSSGNPDGIVGDGAIQVSSSIINSCGANVTNGGDNVGQCFGDTFVTLDSAVDNGCALLAAGRCPRTIALRPDSPAIGAGDCTGVAFDQRNQLRTPAGPGCDAGAFESAGQMLGDVNLSGAVTNADVQAILEWLAGGPDPLDLSAGDMNQDGFVRLDDALALAQLVADPG